MASLMSVDCMFPDARLLTALRTFFVASADIPISFVGLGAVRMSRKAAVASTSANPAPSPEEFVNAARSAVAFSGSLAI